MESHHVLVIGGSFAGLSAAMQLARARRDVVVVDSGLPRNRYAHVSQGFFGQDGRSPQEILEIARAQVLAYPTAGLRRDEATRARRVDDSFEIDLASGATVRARRLVLATGVIDELPDIPGLRERWGRTVLHCPYCHGYEVAGQRLGILAVGESSMHQSMLLPDWSDDVTLFTNGSFEPSEEQRAVLAMRGVRIESRAVARLLGEGQALSGLQVRGDDGEALIAIDALFTASRTRMASDLAEQLGCAMDEGPVGSMIRVDSRRATTVPGVFAAGDATRFPHNATFASADGVQAGISAHQSLSLPSPSGAAAAVAAR